MNQTVIRKAPPINKYNSRCGWIDYNPANDNPSTGDYNIAKSIKYIKPKTTKGTTTFTKERRVIFYDNFNTSKRAFK